jgi:DNA-binding MarR family transcriptional regulator
MKYALLQSLLPHIEAYETAHPGSGDVRDFAVWLGRQTAEAPGAESARQPKYPGDTEEVAISRLMIFLTRYARTYGRKALEGSVLGSLDEFVYLITLQSMGSMTKTDLIQRNRHEKPTGMDIIRRLLQLGLITQTEDPDDRRSKQLTITPDGAAVAGKLYGRMGLVSHIVAGNLTKTERIELLQLLEKLENFHQVLLAKTRGEGFEGVVHAWTSNVERQTSDVRESE